MRKGAKEKKQSTVSEK